MLSLLDKEINSLILDSKAVLKDAHKLCKKLNQSVQRYLYEKKYDNIIQTVEEFIKSYSLCNVAQKAVTMVKKIILYRNLGEVNHSEILRFFKERCEHLEIMTFNYHDITAYVLPVIKLYIKVHKQISSSLLNGSPDIELTFNYIMFGKFKEDRELVQTDYIMKLKEVAPNVVTVSQQASQQ